LSEHRLLSSRRGGAQITRTCVWKLLPVVSSTAVWTATTGAAGHPPFVVGSLAPVIVTEATSPRAEL
jgi:hypothetical protein